MSDDQFDFEMRSAARDAMAEVERGVGVTEVEAALDESTAGGPSYVRVGTNEGAGGSRRTWVALAAAASVVGLAIAGAFVLIGGDDQITSDSTPTTQATVPVVPTAPSTVTTTPSVTTNPAVPATTPPVTAASTTDVPVTTASTDEEVTVTTMAMIPDPIIVGSLDDVPYERYLPDAQCLEDDCAQIEYDQTGAAWTFSNGVLTEHVRGGAGVTLPEPWRSADIRDIGLLAIGPDEVAYFTVYQAPESSSLVGVSVADADAGQQVVLLDGAIDFSGDTYYVPTTEGLAIVGCCGPDQVRPAPAAELLTEWLDRADDRPRLPTITFDAEELVIGNDGGLVWRVGVDPQQLMARGMPRVTRTHDGGLIAEFTGLGSTNYIVRGWPNGSTSVAELSFDIFVSALTPEGFVVSVVDGNFVVADLFVERPPTERVNTTIDFETGIVTMAGGMTNIADAHGRLAYADLIAGGLQLGERRTIDAQDATAGVVVVTTEGYFDDSVFGSRFTIDFENQTIMWSQTCQPDRGQQDYQTALCV